jgi:hypothetical protein
MPRDARPYTRSIALRAISKSTVVTRGSQAFPAAPYRLIGGRTGNAGTRTGGAWKRDCRQGLAASVQLWLNCPGSARTVRSREFPVESNESCDTSS